MSVKDDVCKIAFKKLGSINAIESSRLNVEASLTDSYQQEDIPKQKCLGEKVVPIKLPSIAELFHRPPKGANALTGLCSKK